jgi:hypothetical protein
MSGLIENKNSNVTYLSIIGGKVTQRFKEHQVNAKGEQVTIERNITDDDGNHVKTVIERHYGGIEGHLKNISMKDGEYGTTLEVRMVTENNEYNLSFKLDSSYGRSFMFRLPNIDPNKEVKLIPYNFEDKEKTNSKGQPKKVIGINVFQKDCGLENDKVLPFWTKDNPGDLPAWEQKTVAGKTKWNSDAQLDFLYNFTEQWSKDNLESLTFPEPVMEASGMDLEQAHAKKIANLPSDSEEQDDLPF